MKQRFWTSSEFTPIFVRSFPPLRRGGGGVVPAEPMAWYAGPELLGLAELPDWPSMFVMPCPPALTPPSQGGGKGSLALSFDRAHQKHAPSKPSREHVQPCRFITPPGGGPLPVHSPTEIDEDFMRRTGRQRRTWAAVVRGVVGLLTLLPAHAEARPRPRHHPRTARSRPFRLVRGRRRARGPTRTCRAACPRYRPTRRTRTRRWRSRRRPLCHTA